jgi:NADH-quinone oxidoreductase subunit C
VNDYDPEAMLLELQEQMGEKLVIYRDRFFSYLHTAPADLPALAKILREKYGFNHLANLTSVDYDDNFEIVYHLYSIPDNRKIVLKTRVPRDKPEIDSVFSVWPAADWQEREIYDLMGITFKNHPNLIRILMPDDYVGHPLRKDFKLGGRASVTDGSIPH